jgi:hypothetical protein
MRREALPTDAPQLKSLYAVVLVTLGIILIGGVAAWTGFVFSGKTMPDGLSNLLSLVAGGLLGVLAPQPAAGG